ncbi:hypothetical protein JHN52_21915 [Streptomyces sp. MBT97]|uniref:hypothetical protein n=1 Tax=Streptomyces sp. MBT97 TaxID=2800411 RepID=UPI00190A5E5B|nr:hypothetical protein [Streptomyces sp. MBT97]MBK3635531.1 hypothetical protein [Streptomyces sp. MBT97]
MERKTVPAVRTTNRKAILCALEGYTETLPSAADQPSDVRFFTDLVPAATAGKNGKSGLDELMKVWSGRR